MKTQQRSILLVVLVLILSPCCLAQTQADDPLLTQDAKRDSNTRATPPTDALAPFEPFIGLYEFAGEWEGAPYRGTLEVKPAVKGWYVEWVINVHSVRESDPPIDRQLRMLTSWDRFAEQYRIWRFETNNPVLMGGGKARFDGDAFIMEWRTPGPDGERGTFRNRVFLKSPDEIVIVSEGERDSGEVEQIGVGTGKRRL